MNFNQLSITISGEVISEKYILEYGSDCLEMHVGAVKPHERALVVDDLIATGGTLCAAMNLLGELTLIFLYKLKKAFLFLFFLCSITVVTEIEPSNFWDGNWCFN